jgi:hypothetical protein
LKPNFSFGSEAAEVGVEDQEDRDQREHGEREQPVAGGLLVRELTADLGVVGGLEVQGPDRRLGDR